MKKILGMAALAAVVSGCVSHMANEEVKPYLADNVKSAPATDRPYVEGATLRPLRVLVSMDGGPNERSPAFQLSGYLQSHLEGELAKRGYRVVYDRPSEILISTCGPVTCQLLNQRGSRVV